VEEGMRAEMTLHVHYILRYARLITFKVVIWYNVISNRLQCHRLKRRISASQLDFESTMRCICICKSLARDHDKAFVPLTIPQHDTIKSTRCGVVHCTISQLL
jgi:hypothetical protein